MQKLAAIFCVLFASSAAAGFNEFECDFSTPEGLRVLLEVESPLGSSRMRDVNMTVSQSGEFRVYHYYVSASFVFNKINYWGDGLDLDIDLWPNERPRYGVSYSARLTTWDLEEDRHLYQIQCTYTDI